MHWIYLSPHLDDAVLSCGGLIWEQTHAGEHVEIWTVCAGDPPAASFSPFARTLHARWRADESPAGLRRREDRAASRTLVASVRHFPVPDCIYRTAPGGARPLYASEEALFGPVDPKEAPLVEKLAEMLADVLPEGASPVSPLALGGHVDHRLTRAALERLGRPLWYYPDYPYLLDLPEWEPAAPGPEWEGCHVPISYQGLEAWQQAVAAYRSQLSTFWDDEGAMRAAVEAYWRRAGGLWLYYRADAGPPRPCEGVRMPG